MTADTMGHNSGVVETEQFIVAQKLNAALREYRETWGSEKYVERLQHALAAHAKAEALRRE